MSDCTVQVPVRCCEKRYHVAVSQRFRLVPSIFFCLGNMLRVLRVILPSLLEVEVPGEWAEITTTGSGDMGLLTERAVLV